MLQVMLATFFITPQKIKAVRSTAFIFWGVIYD